MIKISTLFVLLTLSATAMAKHGGRDNGDQNFEGSSNCNESYIRPHNSATLAPFVKITCDFKEYLNLPSKGDHCGEGATARVVFFDNCTIPPQTHPSINHLWIQYGVAATTYFPGRRCWSEAEHSAFIDNINWGALPVGTRVELTMGQGFGMGKGSGAISDEDVHEIRVGNQSICTTDHATNGRQMTGIPHILSLVSSENVWLRETK